MSLRVQSKISRQVNSPLFCLDGCFR